ncbi:pentapeptide repeat-containing protein [Vibrio olivae]
MSLIKLPQTRLFDVTFVDCKMVGIDWTHAHWPSFNLDHELRFKRCILNDSSWFGLTLNELHLEACKLHDADFREADLARASLTECDFQHALFMRTNLHSADFTDATHFQIDVLENVIAQAKFSRYEALALLDSLGIELVD